MKTNEIEGSVMVYTSQLKEFGGMVQPDGFDYGLMVLLRAGGAPIDGVFSMCPDTVHYEWRMIPRPDISAMEYMWRLKNEANN